MALSELEYVALAEPELGRLLSALDALGEQVDAELSNDILTLEFEDGARFVINSHRAARQIWMAAESRAWHFDYEPERGWVANKSGDELWSTLRSLLDSRLGQAVSLERAR